MRLEYLWHSFNNLCYYFKVFGDLTFIQLIEIWGKFDWYFQLFSQKFWGHNTGAFVVNKGLNTLHIDPKAAVKTALLPGIIPRLHDLFSAPFIYLAYGYACLFALVKLLPQHHPYLQPKNFGKYGLFHVIGAAGQNITFNLQNIDRILAYFSVIASIIILFILMLLALVFLVINAAWAQGAPLIMPNMMQLFTTAAPQDDIALMMLDATFGIPGIFGSSMMPAAPSPFHAAMQNVLFGTYNYLFLFFAVLIAMMHIIHVVFEITQTGRLFGGRFNSFWGPMRLVLGIGLLIPVAYGLNSAQYIILYAAKFGSGLATNSWLALNTHVVIPLGGVDVNSGNYRNIVTEPPTPDLNPLIGAMHVIKTCEFFYENANGGNTSPNYRNIQAYQIYGNSAAVITGSGNYNTAITNSNGGPINIRFGYQNPEIGKYSANIVPLCGELTIDVETPTAPGAAAAYEAHFTAVMNLYNNNVIDAYAEHLHHLHVPGMQLAAGCMTYPAGVAAGCQQDIPENYGEYFFGPGGIHQMLADSVVVDSVTELQASADLNKNVAARGWAGAGLWYINVADMNGINTSAAMSVASLTKAPLVFDDLLNLRMQKDKQGSTETLLDIATGDGEIIDNIGSEVGNEAELVKVLMPAYMQMMSPLGDLAQNSISDASATNIIEMLLNTLFGTSGIANMLGNTDTHPLYQLTGVGRGLIEASIRNLLTSTLTSAGSGLLGQLGMPALQTVSGAISGITGTIGSITLTAGIILFYIVPLMPFIYFFFACGRWVKSVFEALVGAPLWAIAHLRYEGEGVGDMAISGYYLTFEIFIRPILVVFGLIAALSIFGAMVTVLNDIWSLVTTNLTGFEFDAAAADVDTDSMRNRIDQLFFTILYVIVVYIMANTSFKLIDMIPNQILRWMGSSTSSFGDMSQDNLETLTQTAAISGAQMVPQVTNAASKAAGMAGTGVGAGLKGMMGK